MTRAHDLPYDYYGAPPDEPDLTCECGTVEPSDSEFCSAHRCATCCAEAGCHIECVTCHRFVDEGNFDDECAENICVDCLVVAQEREEARREDAHSDERGELSAACRAWREARV